jgi:hypothetical protein
MNNRQSYSFRNAEDAEKFRAWLAVRDGFNPSDVEPPQDPSKDHANWIVQFDGKPRLSKDRLQPEPNQMHYMRPEYHRTYGHWFSPQKPDFDRCCVEIYGSERGSRPHQCTRKAAADSDYTGKPTRCKFHSRAKLLEKEAKWQAKFEADRARMDALYVRQNAQREAIGLIEQIADGHNNPRGAAIDFLVSHGLRNAPDEDTY